MIRVKDLIEAEKRLDEAQEELRQHRQPENWSAREELDRDGRRHIHMHKSHFEQEELLLGRVERARGDMYAKRRQFIEGD